VKKKAFIVILLAILTGGAYWGYTEYTKNKLSHGLQATGTIEATQVELRAKLPGTLQNITVKTGDQVKRGQPVAVVIRNDLIAQKERDALGVLKARALLDDLTSGAREQEIKSAEIAIQIARTNYDQAIKDHDRALALFQESVISESEVDKCETALKQSQNQLDAAQSKLDLLLAGVRPEQIEAAKTELERSIAILKSSEAMLEDAKITCPIDGTVLSKNFEEGEYVLAGAPVATIADLNNMWVKVYIPTDDLPKIKLGQQVVFTVSGSPTEYKGMIKEIASQGEFTPKTIQTKKERTNIVYAVKVEVNNDDGVFKPGMPADVVIY